MNGMLPSFAGVTFVVVLPSVFVDGDATSLADSMKHGETQPTQKTGSCRNRRGGAQASWARASHFPAINGFTGLSRYRVAYCERRLSSIKKGLIKTSDRVHAQHRNASAVLDPAFVPFVSASVDEIRYAQRLRDRLRERYPNRPLVPVSYWSVGAD